MKLTKKNKVFKTDNLYLCELKTFYRTKYSDGTNCQGVVSFYPRVYAIAKRIMPNSLSAITNCITPIKYKDIKTGKLYPSYSPPYLNDKDIVFEMLKPLNIICGEEIKYGDIDKIIKKNTNLK